MASLQSSPSPHVTFVAAAAADGWLIASGEIDMVTAPELALALATRDYEGVDLDAVTFMDVSGLRVLLEAGRRAQAAGRRLAVANASPQIRRLFALTAIDQTLDVIVDQSSAVTSLYPMSSSSRASSPP